MLALSADDDLLDIGCGPCAFLAEHAQQARTVTGLDPSRTMLREAEKRLSERISAGTARLVLAGSKHLPFDDGAFSAVTVITAPADLAEAHRVLRRGGRLVVVDELAADPRKPSSQRTGGAAWPYNEVDTLRLLEQAGFSDPTVPRLAGAELSTDSVGAWPLHTAGCPTPLARSRYGVEKPTPEGVVFMPS